MMSGEPLRSEDSNYDAPFAALDATGDEAALDDVARCARCGYLLYGLTDEQRCPECAFPAGASRQGPWLKFADPQWLRRLMIGAFIVMVTTSVLSLYHVLVFFFPAVTANWYVGICFPVLFLLDLAGYWLLSSPDPSHVGEQVSASTRSGLRLIRIPV